MNHRLIKLIVLAIAVLAFGGAGALLFGSQAQVSASAAPISALAPHSPSAPNLTDTATATPTCGPANWSSQASYPVGIRDNAVVALGGLVYSFGGHLFSGATANAYSYNPATNVWTAIAPLPATRYAAGAVSDGTYIYILNGFGPSTTTNTLFKYNPATNSYTTLSPAPSASAAQGAAYLAGKIYRVGGCSTSCDFVTNTVDVYDVATNVWSASGTIANFPSATYNQMVVSFGSALYSVGGLAAGVGVAINKTYRYDPTTNTWNDAAITDLPQTRADSAYDVMQNGRLVLAGGDVGGVRNGTVVSLDLNAPTDVWATLPTMPAPRLEMGGASVGQAFYTVGGHGSEPA